MPENAARKRRARELARRLGIAYTTALRMVGGGAPPAGWAQQKLKQAYADFGRQVGVIAEPSLSGPHLMGTEGYGERLSHVWLGYGDRPGRPDAFIGTHRPLPGDESDTWLFVTGLHNFMAQHEWHSGDRAPGDLNPDGSHDLTVRALHAVQTAPREAAGARFHDGLWPCVRVRIGGFEALEIPYEDGSIVYCGLASMSGTVRFGLKGAD
ncbi:hypothetical protein [Streptomyces sp. HUAS ZL42]|uniref:hypothetical protein n=1 Tax=Streptomyces sp. HUAS ZL42 TaxID=3231715 RepID=UPI00345EFF35